MITIHVETSPSNWWNFSNSLNFLSVTFEISTAVLPVQDEFKFACFLLPLNFAGTVCTWEYTAHDAWKSLTELNNCDICMNSLIVSLHKNRTITPTCPGIINKDKWLQRITSSVGYCSNLADNLSLLQPSCVMWGMRDENNNSNVIKQIVSKFRLAWPILEDISPVHMIC